MYLWLKNAHVVLAYVTVAGFLLRALWSILDSPYRNRRWVRIAPHVIDTLLLVLGITLAVLLAGSPFAEGWLNAKLIGLLAYIGFGVMTMRASARSMKLVGLIGALTSVAYIFAVAMTKQVWPL